MLSGKRILGAFLALILLFPAWLQTDSLAEPLVWDGSVDISWYAEGETAFTLTTPAQLAGLAALVNGRTDEKVTKGRITGDASLLVSYSHEGTELTGSGGGNTSDTTYMSAIDFAGVTISLGADMDMGGVYDTENKTWSGPNWTPIGGKYPLDTTTSGDCLLLDTRFNGVLDGQGHTITNLYCDRYTAKGFAYSQCVGLVGYLGSDEYFVRDEYDRGDAFDYDGYAAKEKAIFDAGWVPAVRNLVVTGYVYARRMVGGVVGRCGDAANGVAVECCANFCSVYNTDSKGVGGVVGSGWTEGGVIRNCYNAGHVETTYTCPMGGISGSNSMDIYNCYNIGSIDSNGNDRDRGIGSHNSGVYTVDNCHWLTGSASEGYYTGGNGYISVNVTEQTAAYLRSDAFLAELNADGAVFVKDTDGLNDGYPILYFQAKDYDPTISYLVSLEQPTEGGTIGSSQTGLTPCGASLTFSAVPDTGWALDCYLVNGVEIVGDHWTLMDNVTVSARFYRLREVTIHIPSSTAYSVSVTKDGQIYKDGALCAVKNYPVSDGDTLIQRDMLTITAALNEGAEPSDEALEYTGAFSVTAENTENMMVTGEGDVLVAITPLTQKKSWDTLADTTWYVPEANDYCIGSAAELAGLAVLVSGGVSFAGKTIYLTNDVDLTNTDGTSAVRYFSRIGSDNAHAFMGVFDGCGHSIYHMNGLCKYSYGGLFGYAKDAVIRSLAVEGAYTGLASATGGIVGTAENCSLLDCTSRVTLTGTSTVGGVVGSVKGTSTVKRCVNAGTVTASSSYVGGVAGEAADTASLCDCSNTASVTATHTVGGVVGRVSGTGEIKRCENTGTVTATFSNAANSFAAGGLIGVVTGAATVDECLNTAAVTSLATAAGGLVGRIGNKDAKLKNAYNLGDVTNTSPSANAAAGGLVGVQIGSAAVENCYNAGTIRSTNGSQKACFGMVTSTANCSNCYYLDTSGSVDTAAAAVTRAQLKALASSLGDSYAAGASTPQLCWQLHFPVGDADLNGLVNTADAASILRATVKLCVPNVYATRAADTDGNGSANAADAARILRFTVKLEQALSPTYPISIAEDPLGRYTVTSTVSAAQAGEQVTLTVTRASSAYSFDLCGVRLSADVPVTTLTPVLDAYGSVQQCSYRFTMPNEPVQIEVLLVSEALKISVKEQGTLTSEQAVSMDALYSLTACSAVYSVNGEKLAVNGVKLSDVLAYADVKLAESDAVSIRTKTGQSLTINATELLCDRYAYVDGKTELVSPLLCFDGNGSSASALRLLLGQRDASDQNAALCLSNIVSICVLRDHSLSVAADSDGVFGISAPAYAKSGEAVAVTVTRAGAALNASIAGLLLRCQGKEISLSPAASEQDAYGGTVSARFTFVMPSGDVELHVTAAYAPLTISSDGTEKRSFSRQELTAMVQPETIFFSARTSSNISFGLCTGVYLTDVLDAAGVSFGEGDSIRFVGRDGASVSVDYAFLFGNERRAYRSEDDEGTPLAPLLSITYDTVSSVTALDTLSLNTQYAYRLVIGQESYASANAFYMHSLIIAIQVTHGS